MTWCALAGLAAGISLLAHVAWLAPGALGGAVHPGFAALRAAATALLVSAALAAAVAGVGWLARRWLARRGPAAEARLVIGGAVVAGLAPAALSWVLFRAFDGHLGAAVIASALAVVVGLVAIAHLLSARLARLRTGPSWIASSVVLVASALVWAAPFAAPELVATRAVAEPGPISTEPAAPARPLPEPSVLLRPERPDVVVLLTVDTLRADHLGAYGYGRATSPNIDRLAREGLLLERMIAPSSGTVPSFIAMHTGLGPECTGGTSQVSVIPEAVATLGEIFQGRGYETLAVVGNHLLDERRGFARGYDQFRLVAEGTDDARLDAVEELFDRVEGFRVFAWVHLFGPHTPYKPDEDSYPSFLGDALYVDRPLPTIDFGATNGVHFARTFGRGRARTATVTEGEVVALYDGEIVTTDRAIGRLLALLEARGVIEQTALVFTADHGEVLYRSARDIQFQHAHDIWQDTLHVPAIVWAPGRIPAGLRSDAMVTLADVVPSLLQLARVDAPGPMQGRPFLGAGAGRDAVVARSAYWDGLSLALLPIDRRRPRLALVTPGLKLLDEPDTDMTHVDGLRPLLHAWRSTLAGHWPPDRMFDLQADPGERADRIGEMPEVARRMRGEIAARLSLEASVDCPEGGRPTGPVEMDPAVREQLRALGYGD